MDRYYFKYYIIAGLIVLLLICLAVGYYKWYTNRINRMVIKKGEKVKLISPTTTIKCLVVVGMISLISLYAYAKITELNNKTRYNTLIAYTIDNNTVAHIYEYNKYRDHPYADFISENISEDDYSIEKTIQDNAQITIYTSKQAYNEHIPTVVIIMEYLGESEGKTIGVSGALKAKNEYTPFSQFGASEFTKSNSDKFGLVITINTKLDNLVGIINCCIIDANFFDNHDFTNAVMNYFDNLGDDSVDINDYLSEEQQTHLLDVSRIEFTVDKTQ